MTPDDLHRLVAEVQSRQSEMNNVEVKAARSMVKRIVKKFQPDNIIPFGSHARGRAGLDSDIDLRVVMPENGSVFEKGLQIRRALLTSLSPWT